MFWSFVIVCAGLWLAVSAWVLTELELRDTQKALEKTERDLVIALAWDELAEESLQRTIHPTLSLVDGGDA
jgi:hypothetical protein